MQHQQKGCTVLCIVIRVFHRITIRDLKEGILKGRLLLKRTVEVPEGCKPAAVADIVVKEVVKIFRDLNPCSAGATLSVTAPAAGGDGMCPSEVLDWVDVRVALDPNAPTPLDVLKIEGESSAEAIFDIPPTDNST